jgi:hypothetical protein
MGNKKWVSFPINVPVSDFCWKPDEQIMCQYFDNEGGHESCNMDFYGQKRTPEGHVTKASGCVILAEFLEEKNDGKIKNVNK